MKLGACDPNRRVVVVAEIGNNHEGNPDIAAQLVREAAAAGVDAVKFQTFRTHHFVSASDPVRFGRLRGFELSQGQFRDLADLARSLGLLFISTPFDLASAEFLLGVADAIKLASGDVNFFPLLELVSSSDRPVVLSSGGSELEEVETAAEFIRSRRPAGLKDELAVLHCVSAYPVPPDQVNLQVIGLLSERLGCTIGYSDHTVGLDAALAAVALGARIVEKHFTLDREFSDFRDHQLSADPAEMAELVRRVRLLEQMLGQRKKIVQPSESANIASLRRSIVAGRSLHEGHRLTLDDLTWIRPAGGLPPGAEDQLSGRILKRDVDFGEILMPSDVD